MLKLINKIMGNKTSSPKGGKRGCVCKDGTYSSKCCNGELQEQGIGSTVAQSNATVTNTNAPRVITNVSS
jgi:hypothetical protein